MAEDQFKHFSLGKMFRDKKAQTAGLITGLIFGIASLVIGVIIAFVIVSTLSDADLLSNNRESVTVSGEIGWINNTPYSLTGLSVKRAIPSTFAITNIANVTNVTPSIIVSGNYTLTNGILTNSTEDAFGNVTINYTYSLYNREETSTDDLSGNFTAGVDNVSGKIPTVLLVAAIVLILGVLAILVGVWQRMRMGGGGGL